MSVIADEDINIEKKKQMLTFVLQKCIRVSIKVKY
jgi:hypothetical protein